ncbi:MAG: uracil-DNA glycosylase [Calditrichaeota bacterium]|nr:uracil-DNA glycosylase [Calditrichota bacterium]
MSDTLKRYLDQYREVYGEQIPVKNKLTDNLEETIETVEFVREPEEPYQVETKTESVTHELTLSGFHQQIKNCQNCYLGSCRTNFVFGKGNEHAKILVIGEAPGHDEDMQGLPFVGKAGQLLDKILAAIDLSLQDVYITNIVKCRPPNNRDPQPEEINACNAYLQKQIELIQPKLILALGRIAAHTLLNTSDSLSKLRGRFHDYQGKLLLVTYHPSALLRNEMWKRPTWEDMKLFRQKYNEILAVNE